MKRKLAAALLALAFLVPLSANAQSPYRSSASSGLVNTNKVYLGLKYGILTVSPDASGSDDIDVDNMGFVFGGFFNDWMAMEFEYTQTVSADKEDLGTSSVKFRTDTFGIFLVGVLGEDLYGKARVGYSWLDQEVSSVGGDTVYGLAFGVGAGYKFSNTATVELEYTIYPETDEFDRFGRLTGDDLETEMVAINLVLSYD